jgi:hypothetical protein
MKRSPPSSPALPGTPDHKKSRLEEPEEPDAMGAKGWTKVGKRKQKKNQKTKTKSDVCVCSRTKHFVPLRKKEIKCTDVMLSSRQNTKPRFMYHNSEIHKRSQAVYIDVRRIFQASAMVLSYILGHSGFSFAYCR